MNNIIITTPHRCEFINHSEFTLREQWQKEPAADYLKLFLLANFPVHVRDTGLPDEEHKTLQYYGQTVWEEGQTKAKFWGNTYEVINN
jgi:hypothetical protein